MSRMQNYCQKMSSIQNYCQKISRTSNRCQYAKLANSQDERRGLSWGDRGPLQPEILFTPGPNARERCTGRASILARTMRSRPPGLKLVRTAAGGPFPASLLRAPGQARKRATLSYTATLGGLTGPRKDQGNRCTVQASIPGCLRPSNILQIGSPAAKPVAALVWSNGLFGAMY